MGGMDKAHRWESRWNRQDARNARLTAEDAEVRRGKTVRPCPAGPGMLRVRIMPVINQIFPGLLRPRRTASPGRPGLWRENPDTLRSATRRFRLRQGYGGQGRSSCPSIALGAHAALSMSYHEPVEWSKGSPALAISPRPRVTASPRRMPPIGPLASWRFNPRRSAAIRGHCRSVAVTRHWRPA